MPISKIQFYCRQNKTLTINQNSIKQYVLQGNQNTTCAPHYKSITVVPQGTLRKVWHLSISLVIEITLASADQLRCHGTMKIMTSHLVSPATQPHHGPTLLLCLHLHKSDTFLFLLWFNPCSSVLDRKVFLSL